MHPAIFEEFDAICGDLDVRGEVLEIGASPDHQSLLALPSLRKAALRVGVGLDGEADGDGYAIRRLNCHDLSDFADGRFELVVSNSMLEHDDRFWLTIGEARRVTAPGGYMIFGVPGFGPMGGVPGRRLLRLISWLPLVGRRWREASIAVDAASLTLGLHEFPRDYYRFSEQAVADIVLEGMEQVTTRLILSPPRVIGVGRKPVKRAP